MPSQQSVADGVGDDGPGTADTPFRAGRRPTHHPAPGTVIDDGPGAGIFACGGYPSSAG